jgi:hypothetical protein
MSLDPWIPCYLHINYYYQQTEKEFRTGSDMMIGIMNRERKLLLQNEEFINEQSSESSLTETSLSSLGDWKST